MITVESPTRVTLALDIIRLIEEGPTAGYHELGIVKHMVALSDTLHVEAARGSGPDTVECADERVPEGEANICVQACKLVRERFGHHGGPLKVTIEKRIPVMGGMAGGSANAAAMLRAIDEAWDLGLSLNQFRELGRTLGMDVPFFFTGGTAFDSEATKVISPIDTPTKLHIILAVPGFGVSTRKAYATLDYSRVGKNKEMTQQLMAALRNNDFESIAKYMHNDFELSIFEQYPRLREIRDSLLSAGCAAACMSGSGSTVIGIAKDSSSARKIAAGIDCRTIVTETL
ncbi:MAG: 4-(cytidine 5'-diphospho)-2-C-methyl-D-erythritol kinase [Chitinispirillia bacterium]|nr:4-(cytidine 5'-diphospho)-2-C-methyl-D-erythritol kinase [Chitinispirillia bacterium]MCL2241040.1 4-(cytidine 5'-diphospho)-2-C-methyl-D-erythritol kinase [Chitinispirillia bacterium]